METIRDRAGRTIGRIYEQGEIYIAKCAQSGRTLATYNSRTDVTTDANGRQQRGDTLMRFF